MKKIFSIIAMLFLTTCLFAANTVNMKLGKFDVTAIKIQSMNHKKELFRYKDTKKLEEFLNQTDSNASAINVFYVDTGDHKILFDTGINAPALLEALKSINVEPKSIDTICITHMHYDHITGLINDYNKTFPKANVYIAQEEITEDFNQLVGTEDTENESSLLLNCIKRLRWLSFAVVNTLLSPFIISLFQDAIQQIVALAVLMPIAGALGGNIGIQTASVIIKAFSTEEFREERYKKSIYSETLIGIINGIIIGILLGLTAFFWFHEWKLSLVLCGAMIFCSTCASFIGVALPIVFYRFGYDSSLSSGPLITTITDVSGYIVFLSLARLFLC